MAERKKSEVRSLKSEVGDAIVEKPSDNNIEKSKPHSVNRQPSTVNSSINKEQKKELQKQQRIFQQLEEKIAELTNQKKHLEGALSDSSTYSDKNKFIQTETDYKKVTEQLSAANKEYEIIFEKIVVLEAGLTS